MLLFWAKLKNFYLYLNYESKFHLINILFIITPLIQFISLNIFNGDLIFYTFLLVLNIIFIILYYLIYKIIKKYFFSSYKDIIFICVFLFFLQFQFSDIYNLSIKINIRSGIILSILLFIFFVTFLIKKKFFTKFVK